MRRRSAGAIGRAARHTLLMRLFALGLLGIALLLAGCGQAGREPQAVRGVLDARASDLRAHTLALEGEWSLYYGRLLTPAEARTQTPSAFGQPKNWPFRHGVLTARLVVKTPARSRIVALSIATMLTASEVYLNGERVSQVGVVTTEAARAEVGLRPFYRELTVENGELEIVVRASNWDFMRGAVYGFQLGEAAPMRVQLVRHHIVTAFLLGTIVIMAVYHVGLFLLRRKERAPLYFAVMCLCLAAFNTVAGGGIVFELWPGVTGELWFKAFMIPWMLAQVAASYFVHALFPDEFNPRTLRPQLYLAAAMCTAVALLPLRAYGFLGHVAQLTNLYVIGYCLTVIVRAFRKKRDGARLLLGGIAGLSLTVLSDILSTEGVTHMPLLSPMGMVLLILALSLVWAARIANTYAAVEQSQRARTALFHNTSHELRTPLNGILGFVKLLRSGHFGELTPGLAEPVQKIQHLANGLLTHVNTILDLARSQHGRFEVRVAEVSVLALVQEAQNLSDGLALREPDLHFTLDVPFQDGQGPTVLTDRDKVLAILRNLIGNAFKFRRPGAPHTVTLRVRAERGQLLLSVRDTGIGIAEQDQKRIFEEFAQVESSANRNYEGTGLGLALVQRLVLALGGAVCVESRLGEGSTFHVSLPAPEVERGAGAREVQPLVHHAPASALEVGHDAVLGLPDAPPHDHVLVVDDNPTNLELVERVLVGSGYRVVTASGGELALRLVQESRPDLVLLDLMMPQVSGEDVLRAIRANAALADLPVILLTARASDDDRLLGLRMGADDYLAKPVDPSELVLRVHNTLVRAQLARDKLAHEAGLAAAQAVQQTLLPSAREFPGIDLADHYQAAELTGGDWYGYAFDEQNQRLFVAVGDATGHGVSASLLTGTASGAFKATCFALARGREPTSLADALREIASGLNHALLGTGTGAERRMTMALVALDVSTGEGAYLNAGHQPVFMVRRGQTSTLLRPGSPLGVESEAGYQCDAFRLAIDDALLLFTDGLVENQGPDGRTLSVRRIRRILAETPDVGELKHALLSAGGAIWRERPGDDDCSFVLLRFRGDPAHISSTVRSTARSHRAS